MHYPPEPMTMTKTADSLVIDWRLADHDLLQSAWAELAADAENEGTPTPILNSADEARPGSADKFSKNKNKNNDPADSSTADLDRLRAVAADDD